MSEAGASGSHPTAPVRRDRPRTLRLRSHLAILALALILPALGLGAVVVWHAVEAYRAAFEGRLQDTARALALAVDREIGTVAATLTGLAAGPRLDADATERDLLEFRTRAADIAEALGSYIVVVGPAPDFRTELHTRVPPGTPLPTGTRLPSPDAPLPRVFATARPAIGGVARGAALDRHTAFIFVPVIREGRVIRAIGMALDPEPLAALLRAQGLPADWPAAVVDARGNIAARSRDHARFVGGPATPWYVAGTQGRQGGFLRGVGVDGVELVLGFAALPSAAGWTVAVAAPLSAYRASWRRPLEALALGGGLLLLLGMGMALILGQRLVRPVRALAARAEAVARASDSPVSAPLPPSAITEVETLRQGLAAAETALRDRAEMARAGEERLRLAVEGTGMATWDLDAATGRLVWSRHHFLMLGHDPDDTEQATIDTWRARVHPDDLPEVEAAWARAERDGGLFHVGYRIRRADDGTIRWMESYGRYIRHGTGAGRFVGVMFDVTERRLAEERQALLMREVDHRAKNALAVVQSVVRLTRAESPAAYATAVEGRVRALARAHELLARDRWQGAGLHELAREELAAYLKAGQAGIEGPPVGLVPEAAQPVAMVLHELATNAAKHGALSQPEGRVALSWRSDGAGGVLRVTWTERGGPPVAAPPGRAGFGSRLIETTIRSQLGGSVTFAWEPSGLRCDIAIPTDRLARRATRPARAQAPVPAAAPASLRGLHVLVVEDEALIATDLVETLHGLGCVLIGPAGTLVEALRLAEAAGRLDAAVLDVNLHGQATFPVADALAARGVPVIFATGYSELPEGRGGIRTAVLRKPVAPADLAAALHAAVGPAAA